MVSVSRAGCHVLRFTLCYLQQPRQSGRYGHGAQLLWSAHQKKDHVTHRAWFDCAMSLFCCMLGSVRLPWLWNSQIPCSQGTACLTSRPSDWALWEVPVKSNRTFLLLVALSCSSYRYCDCLVCMQDHAKNSSSGPWHLAGAVQMAPAACSIQHLPRSPSVLCDAYEDDASLSCMQDGATNASSGLWRFAGQQRIWRSQPAADSARLSAGREPHHRRPHHDSE